MGEIKEGKVSGLIPRNEGFAVHYPSYPSSTSRAIQTLGGTESILKARSSQSNTLELYFRPEDPYSHPVSGELRSCHCMLLKITKKKKSSPINDAKQETDEFHADIVARIPEAYYFEGMADYQHVVPVHADVGRKRRKNCKKPGLMDLGPDDVMMLPPPLFSLKDVPENIVLRPPSTSSSRKKQDELPETHPKMTFEPALGIDFKDVEDLHLDMENTSTSYLQQLLNSFPSMDSSVDRKQDGESSDGEYQIYKQDNDENDLDNDYDD